MCNFSRDQIVKEQIPTAFLTDCHVLSYLKTPFQDGCIGRLRFVEGFGQGAVTAVLAYKYNFLLHALQATVAAATFMFLQDIYYDALLLKEVRAQHEYIREQLQNTRADEVARYRELEIENKRLTGLETQITGRSWTKIIGQPLKNVGKVRMP